MQLILLAALGAGTAVALAASGVPVRAPATVAGPPDSALAARIAGHWTGHRTGFKSMRSAPMNLTLSKASDGGLDGQVSVAGEPAFPVQVVWSSDTAFILESAPHKSSGLHEQVVTRSLVHFKGDSLAGRFESRPMKYEGKTATGNFEVGRQT
jgi:hypothetical protein